MTTEKLAAGCVFLDRRGLAEMLGIAMITLDRWRLAGRVPPPAKLNRLCRWPLSQIQDWAARGCPTQAEMDRKGAVGT